ncbi:MAG: UvrD-helicase domain-containing protein, partial [Desulfobacterales bacterium]|nr:UvrD-helicase domain-containing protein [Desulfobacterales bacterium]
LARCSFFAAMKFIADLHIHSHFSRATSKTLDPEHLSLWAQKKGISLIGTGDFTHPGWISELQDKLVKADNGIYKLKPALQKTVDSQVPPSCLRPTRFLLSGEISCIYKKNGKTRKIHNLVLLPDIASVLKLNERLDRIGNIHSDGRPILGLDARDLLEIVLETSDKAFFIPAHIWTPWFSLFGSKSGFDTLEECFEDLKGHIHALETGLSSDPPMNRCLSSLDKYLLVSNSDAHSPGKLGREANIFDTEMDYKKIIRAMMDGNGFLGTIEFFPEEGKYHLDGHRKCGVRLQPTETREHQGVCPVCGKPLTVGVLNRVHELSDRDTPIRSKDFISLIPLTEVLSEVLGCGPATKKVSTLYERLLAELGPELEIMMDVSLEDLEISGGPVLMRGIDRMRRNQVIRKGGFDGEFGVIRLFDDLEKQDIAGQMALFAKEAISPGGPDTMAVPLTKRLDKVEEKPKAPLDISWADPILGPLNPEQKAAVLYEEGHLLIKAGPGTGKTMTLTHRIAQLIRAGLAAPEQVLAMTFTRKAAWEMEHRISLLLESLGHINGKKNHRSGDVHVRTFHGFCLDILRGQRDESGLLPDFTLCSEVDSKNLAKEILGRSGAGKRQIGRFLKALPGLRRVYATGQADDSPFDGDLLSLFDKYRHGLRDLGMLDLDDLEAEALRQLRNQPGLSRDYGKKFPRVFVDEYQDTNRVQVEILKALVQDNQGTVCAIGDPDQAIYGFRGADADFHSFMDDFPEAGKVVLGRNYRSTKSILKGSAALLEKTKVLQCESSGSDPIFIAPCVSEAEEAEMIVEHVERLIGGTSYFSLDSGRVASYEGKESLGFGDIGILYRINAQGDALEEALDRAGLPLVRSGETPLISRYPINVVWRFLQALQYPDNPYYRKQYVALVQGGGIKKEEAGKVITSENTLSGSIDKIVGLHDLDLSSEESTEAMRRLKQSAGNFEGDMPSFLDMLSLERGIDHAGLLGDRIALMSLHAAKGLEWPIVFIIGCEDQLIPCSLFVDVDIEEERRLLYVGMTRARSRLILSHVKRRALGGRVLKMGPSPFLDAIPKDLCSPLEHQTRKSRPGAHKQMDLFPDS